MTSRMSSCMSCVLAGDRDDVDSKQYATVLLECPTEFTARYRLHTAISTTSMPVSLACGSASAESQPSMAS
jgi:hypothetical protein